MCIRGSKLYDILTIFHYFVRCYTQYCTILYDMALFYIAFCILGLARLRGLGGGSGSTAETATNGQGTQHPKQHNNYRKYTIRVNEASP